MNQYLSHEDLIDIVDSPPRSPARLDAIIVPAGRPANYLFTAIDLARETGCYLVVLCSKETRPQQAKAYFESRKLTKGIAAQVPPEYALPDIDLRTSDWVRQQPGVDACGGRKSDLSVKRNVGLLMARMLDWQHVFFMDDDIRGVSRRDLTRTVSLLGAGYKAAGIRVKHFPDNSVVCHARRLVGDQQEVFVSGAVLAVDCRGDFAFFPDIYNEDWLFFHNDVKARAMASPNLHATKKELQLRYRPFADPQRAAREEFGDVIAEGLYSLLHDSAGGTDNAGTVGYWSQFLDSRRTILKEIDLRLDSAPPGCQGTMKRSIDTARLTLDMITPDMCVSYIRAWKRDLAKWEERLGKLPGAVTPADALRQLGLNPR